MDKLKNVAKHGVHPTGEHEIHRKTWKTDVKNAALRKDPNKAHLDQARSHRSAPLSALKDPDSFGPPPKHSGVHAGASAGSSTSPVSPTTSRQQSRAAPGGWGAPVPAPRRRQEQDLQEEEEAKPSLPYRTDTTGLRTDNLPAPPARRTDDVAGEHTPAPPPRRAAAASPALPARPHQQYQSNDGPVPSLPPRMNEHPDEYTPPAPPPYKEATNATQPAAPLPNQGALNRLGQAGVSVPGLDIGHAGHDTAPQSPSTVQGHVGQLSELQQRFARMNAGADSESPSTASTPSRAHAVAAAAAAKKAPPPPPPKKPSLASGVGSRPSTADEAHAPPPLPFASKPRPT